MHAAQGATISPPQSSQSNDALVPLDEGATDVDEKDKKIMELTSNLTRLKWEKDELELHFKSALAEKNNLLESLRLKASRLEFAQKEALHFLNRPLDKLNAMNVSLKTNPSSKPTSNASQVIEKPTILVTTLFEKEVVECLRFATQYLKNAHLAVNGGTTSNPGVGNTQHSSSSSTTTTTTTTSSSSSSSIIPVSSQSLHEAPLRLINFRAAANDPTLDILSPSSSLITPPSMNSLSTLDVPGATKPSGHTRSMSFTSSTLSRPQATGIDSTLFNPSTTSMEIDPPSTTLPSSSSSSMLAGTDVTDQRPTAFNTSTPSSSPSSSSSSASKNNNTTTTSSSTSCSNCTLLGLRLDHANDALRQLETQMAFLKKNLDMEVNIRERTQLAKEVLETELEELTAQLFDQANKMVEAETKRRDELELTNRGLTVTLKSREEEFQQLKTTLTKLESMKRKSLTSQPPSSQPPSQSQPSKSTTFGGGGSSGGGGSPNTLDHLVILDGHELKQFIEFLKRVTAVSDTSPFLSQDTLNDPFLKKCLVEDIEPCLAPLTAGVLTTLVKKKVMEALIQGQYELQLISSLPNSVVHELASVPSSSSSSSSLTTSHASTSTSTSSSSVFSSHTSSTSSLPKCFLCGTVRECGYGFHSKLQSISGVRPFLPPWNPVDPFCRLRLLSVGQFYSFVYQLKHDKLGQKSILELFKTWLWHRRRMAEARIGSVDLFKDGVELSGPQSTPVVIRN